MTAKWLVLAPACVAFGATASLDLGSLPVHFEPDGASGFIARTGGFGLHLDAGGVAFSRAGRRVRMQFAGALPQPSVEALEPRPGRSNYFLGADPARWRTGVPHFGKVRYRNLYPGVDLVFHGARGVVAYDFHLAPGARPSAIRLRFSGADRLTIGDGGELVARARDGEWRHHRPRVFQENREIAGRFVRRGPAEIGFVVDRFDASLPLVIDPALTYSTYAGGSANDEVHDVKVDTAGMVYATGITASTNFITRNPRQASLAGAQDAFVLKINPSNREIVFATFLGGEALDSGDALDIDAAGNVYVGGFTVSANYPVMNAFQRARGSDAPADGFVTKLSANGSALIYSTFLGGAGGDAVVDLDVDALGRAFILGGTNSNNFPTVNPFQAARRGGDCRFPDAAPCPDAFVARFNAAGSALEYSTYLGGRNMGFLPSGPIDFGGQTEPQAIAAAADGSAVITGWTYTPDFPTTPGVVNPTTTTQSMPSSFVTRINPDGRSLGFSTFIGGPGVSSRARGISLGPTGPWITGATSALGFPVRNAIQTSPRGGQDVFVLNLNTTGTAILYSTFYGGGADDEGRDIVVSPNGGVWVTGHTLSGDFPLFEPLQASANGLRDGFVWSLDLNGKTTFSTYLGGGGADLPVAIDMNDAGLRVFGGYTDSTNFPVVNEFQRSLGGGGDGFVSIIDANAASGPPALALAGAASFSRAAVAPESFVSALAPGLAAETLVAEGLADSLGGRSVKIVDSAGREHVGRIQFISPAQINFLVGPEVALGQATVQVLGPDGAVIAAGRINVERVAPGLFSANSSGQGLAAAVATIVRTDGSAANQLTFRYDQAQARIVAEPVNLDPDVTAAVLTLFGTGIRGRNSLADVKATSSGIPLDVTFAGAQGQFPGLDQVNLSLTSDLAGRGEIPLDLNVGGVKANTVTVFIGGQRQPPLLQSLSPASAEAGSTVTDFTIAGRHLDAVNAISFSPGAIGVTNLRATFNSVTAQLNIPVDAAGDRMVSVSGGAGSSNSLLFRILPSTRASIESVTPAEGMVGQTVNLVFRGRNLNNVSSLTFSPSGGIQTQIVSSTADAVSARATISLAAAINTRQVSVNTPSGGSNTLPFIVRGPASNTPQIADVVFSNVSGSLGSSFTIAGSFNFADADANVIWTGAAATSAKIRFAASASGASCTTETTGSFFSTTPRVNGSISFSTFGPRANLVFTNPVVRVSLIDAAGNQSNVIDVPMARWFCS